MTRQRALTYIHIAAVLFGLTGVFGEDPGGAVVITMGRAVFAVAALGLFARMRRRPLLGALTPAQLFVLVISGALLAAHWVTFFVSVKVGGIAIATLGFASFPAFITLFEGLIFRERVRLAEWLLLGLVTAGLVLVTPSFDLADQGTVGLAWGLLSGLTFALLAQQPPFGLRHGSDAGRLLAEPGWWPGDAALRGGATALGRRGGLALAGAAGRVLHRAVALPVRVSLTRLNARSAGLVIALEPVYAIAFAWALFSQQPTPRMLPAPP